MFKRGAWLTNSTAVGNRLDACKTSEAQHDEWYVRGGEVDWESGRAVGPWNPGFRNKPHQQSFVPTSKQSRDITVRMHVGEYEASGSEALCRMVPVTYSLLEVAVLEK